MVQLLATSNNYFLNKLKFTLPLIPGIPLKKFQPGTKMKKSLLALLLSITSTISFAQVISVLDADFNIKRNAQTVESVALRLFDRVNGQMVASYSISNKGELLPYESIKNETFVSDAGFLVYEDSLLTVKDTLLAQTLFNLLKNGPQTHVKNMVRVEKGNVRLPLQVVSAGRLSCDRYFMSKPLRLSYKCFLNLKANKAN